MRTTWLKTLTTSFRTCLAGAHDGDGQSLELQLVQVLRQLLGQSRAQELQIHKRLERPGRLYAMHVFNERLVILWALWAKG